MNYELSNGIANICIDDGKVNVVNQALVDGMLEALDRATNEAKAIVLSGRSGMFSAGFDLKTLEKGGEEANTLLAGGMEILTRIYAHPQPVVAACAGHAIGLGAFMLLASDIRLGSTDDYQVTLPETAIGMPFTPVLMTLIRDRIGSNFQNAAVLQSKPHNATEAVAAGFLDQAVDPAALDSEATNLAKALGELPAHTYATNKADLRSASLAVMRESIA